MRNSSNNSTRAAPNAWRHQVSPQSVATLALLCVIMLTAIGGNSCLVAHIRRAKRRTGRILRLNCFLANLAAGDLAVGSVVCTGELLFAAFGQWTLGNAMCKMTVYTQSVCLASTAFLLVAMSIDRFEVIVKPLRIFRRNSRITRRILACWLAALMFAAPQPFIFRVKTVTMEETDSAGAKINVSVWQCGSSGYTADWQRKVYVLYVPLFVFAIPTVIMIYCYSRIVLTIWRRTRAPTNAGELSSPSSNSCVGDAVVSNDSGLLGQRLSIHRASGSRLLSRAKIKAVYMSLTVVTAFLACWLPYLLAIVANVFSNGRLLANSALMPLLQHLVLLHSVLNPIIYFAFAGPIADTWACRRCMGRRLQSRPRPEQRVRYSAVPMGAQSNGASTPVIQVYMPRPTQLDE